MSWSWKIARVAGIPIYMHWTFLILIAWVAYGHWSISHDPIETLEGVGFILALFGCVVLHELGHALAARRYGVSTADITLLPIGGVARLKRIPEQPSQELVIAVAGPLVNMVIALSLFLAGVRVTGDWSNPALLVDMKFLPKMLIYNVFLGVFNLIPAFPMDGGRILRALLALNLEYGRATRIAARVGEAIAVLFGFLGLAGGNPMLLLIALFVWIGAESESAQVKQRLMFRGLKVRDALLTDFQILHASDTLGRAVEALLAGSQQDFPIEVDGKVLGLLTRAQMLEGLSRLGRDATIEQVECARLISVEADAALGPAVGRLREHGLPCLQVVENDRVIGLLTLENIAELLMVRAALHELEPNLAPVSS